LRGDKIVIACEPAEVDAMGWGLTEQVEAAVDGAVELVLQTARELTSGVAG